MSSVLTLFEASFYSIIRQKWRNTLLHDLIVDENFEIHSTFPTSNSAMEKREKVAKLILVICSQLLKCDRLPNAIRNTLASAFFEIAFEINAFLGSMVENLKNIDKEKIKYFLHRIILTQDGTIDRKNSVLKIYHDSKFEYRFSNTFLMKNCVERADLEQLGRVVIAELKAQPNQKHLKKSIALIKDNAQLAAKMMILPTVDRFVTVQMVFKYDTENSVKVVLYEKNIHVIKHVYKNIKSANEKQDFLLSISYYAFKENLLFDASFAVFLYENLDMQAWQDLLRLHFCEVFWILPFSCRYRPYMLTWFRQAIGTMSCNTFIKLISDKTWNSTEIAPHERFTMRNLFKKIWDEAPDTFKHEHLVRQAVIKNIVYIIQNFQVLEHILRFYDKSIQIQMLKQTILHYIITRTEDDELEIFNYREELVKVGVNVGLPENALSCAGIKDMSYFILAMDGTKADLLGYEQQVSAYLFEPESSLKMNLVKDKGFMELFLLRHWQTKNMRAIFLWCTRMSIKMCSQYFSRFDDKIFERVYEKVLWQEGDLAIGDQGFTSLQMDAQQVRRIKVNVLSKPVVRKHILTCYFRKGFFDFAKQWQLFYNHIQNGIRGFFREIFATDYGRAALWELILYIEGATSKMQQEEQVSVYTLFCKKFASKYSLNQVMVECLMEGGHPNSWNAPISYQGREPTEQELPELRKVVDFRYRSLLALLHGSSDVVLLTPLNPKCNTLTEVSVRLAEAIQLDIPVVL